jgi:hypothetical protein
MCYENFLVDIKPIKPKLRSANVVGSGTFAESGNTFTCVPSTNKEVRVVAFPYAHWDDP